MRSSSCPSPGRRPCRSMRHMELIRGDVVLLWGPLNKLRPGLIDTVAIAYLRFSSNTTST